MAVCGKRAAAAMPVIGFLSGRSQDEASGDTAAFHQGLNEMGYVDGRNVGLEYRWAKGRNELLPDLAADLVRRQVAVLAAVGGNNSALAAKRATANIPIVFTSSADPVLVGLVASLSHPGGNVTGVSWFDAQLGPKQLRLLSELVPNVTVVVLMVNPQSPEVAAPAGNCAAGGAGTWLAAACHDSQQRERNRRSFRRGEAATRECRS